MSSRRRRSPLRSALSVVAIAVVVVLGMGAAGVAPAQELSPRPEAAGAAMPMGPDPAMLPAGAPEGVAEAAPPAPEPGGGKAKPWNARWVVGYYVGYQRDDYPLEAVDFNAITHIGVGLAVPRADGSVNTSFDLSESNGPVWAKSVVKRAHQHHRKALLVLGGTEAAHTYVPAASEANRAQLVANLKRIVTEYGFDGIDLDWEPLRETDGPTLLALARELRAALPGKQLTIPLIPLMNSAPNGGVLSFYAKLPQYFDQINLMSYGVSGLWQGWDSWHSSPLFGSGASTPISINTSVKSLLAVGIPASKLGIGAGFYGTCYGGVTAPNQSLRSATKPVSLSYSTIMKDYYQAGAQRWDDAAQVPYLSSTTGLGPAKCGFLSYENPQSIAAKAAYVKKHGLGGAIVWNINQGHIASNPAGSRDPLLNAVRRGFLPQEGVD